MWYVWYMYVCKCICVVCACGIWVHGICIYVYVCSSMCILCIFMFICVFLVLMYTFMCMYDWCVCIERVCVSMWEGMCLYVHMCVNAEARGQPPWFLNRFFWDRAHHEPEAHYFPRLEPVSSRDLPVFAFPAPKLQMCVPLCLAFIGVLRTWTQVFKLAQQAFFSPIPLQPLMSLFKARMNPLNTKTDFRNWLMHFEIRDT